jgi:tripartite-type tricarboxylate transporter receptor subunit TctC
VLGDAGVATTNHNASILTREVLGANVKLVSGYSSVAKVSLAMEQGEVNGQYNDWASTKARDLGNIESGEWLVIGQLTEQPLKDLPNVPLMLGFAPSEEQRQLLRYGIVVPNQFTRPYFLPPDVPADRAALLETAFARTMADPEFLADAEKSKLDIAPTSGAQLQQLISAYLAMPPELKSQLARVLPQG